MNTAKFSHEEAFAFLRSLFPDGLKNPALIAELCPNGWEKSPLFLTFHRSPALINEECQPFSQKIGNLIETKKHCGEKDSLPLADKPEDTDAVFLAKHPLQIRITTPETAINEAAELVGLCLWDVFSDNHSVIAADARIVRLGSFRGSAEMISNFFALSTRETCKYNNNRNLRSDDYMDFYMGTSTVRGRADLTPVYELIFRRLKERGADWFYSFARIQAIDFGSSDTDQDRPYDTSAAFQQEAEGLARAEKIAKIRKSIDYEVNGAMRRAKVSAPPSIIQSYLNIFHRFPPGWPPAP